jgi:hypothetical protein
VGTPKLAFVDSGIAANLLGVDVRTLLRPGGPFGPLLEGFVLMELARQLTWSRQRAELFRHSDPSLRASAARGPGQRPVAGLNQVADAGRWTVVPAHTGTTGHSPGSQAPGMPDKCRKSGNGRRRKGDTRERSQLLNHLWTPDTPQPHVVLGCLHHEVTVHDH